MQISTICSIMTGILILIGNLGCIKEVKKVDKILGKCKFPNSFLPYFSETYVVGTHWNCLYEAIPMFTYNICLFNKYIVSFSP